MQGRQQLAAADLGREGQRVPGRAQEDGDAPRDEGLRQALAGLRVPRHDEAEDAPGHGLQHALVRLHLQLIQRKFLVRARHLHPADILAGRRVLAGLRSCIALSHGWHTDSAGLGGAGRDEAGIPASHGLQHAGAAAAIRSCCGHSVPVHATRGPK